jgi:hypothetical protein
VGFTALNEGQPGLTHLKCVLSPILQSSALFCTRHCPRVQNSSFWPSNLHFKEQKHDVLDHGLHSRAPGANFEHTFPFQFSLILKEIVSMCLTVL